jgi:pyridoxal phosphate enzyme (YggS family)
VRLLAVSKGHPAAVIRSAWDCGLRDFGENYVQDWIRKAEDPALLGLEGLRWHFIGRLQRNKIRFLLGRVESIETVDRERLASELARRAGAMGRKQSVLLQVNLEGEGSKSGFTAAELRAGFDALLKLDGLNIRGLMAIPPMRPSAEAARDDHRGLAQLREELQQKFGHPLPELSMGMSSDFEVAIEEGSTEIRLGTALFGPRPRD